MAFDGGGSIRRYLMASAMDNGNGKAMASGEANDGRHDERTRRGRKGRQRNNQPAQ